MKQAHWFIPTSLLAALFLAPSVAMAQCVVNGSLGTISSALAPGASITFTGTCVEDVTVTVDDVFIAGADNTATIQGGVSVVGAQRFTLENLAVENSPEIGVFVTNGASAKIDLVEVSGAPDTGIDVRWGSFAQILDSHVYDNPYGLSIGKGGVVDSFRNLFENNGGDSVDLSEHGTYRGSGDTIRQGEGIYAAIWVGRNSYANLRDAPNGSDPRIQSEVTGLSHVTNQSELRVRDLTTFNGDITVDRQSSLDLDEQPSVTGNVEANNLSIVHVGVDATVDGTVKCHRTSICIED